MVGAALMPVRFFSARVPLPEPKWKQQDGIEGKIATSLDMATGLERAEMLAALEGKNIFDEAVGARSFHIRSSLIKNQSSKHSYTSSDCTATNVEILECPVP